MQRMRRDRFLKWVDRSVLVVAQSLSDQFGPYRQVETRRSTRRAILERERGGWCSAMAGFPSSSHMGVEQSRLSRVLVWCVARQLWELYCNAGGLPLQNARPSL
jgi:hypothetical protein